MTIKNRGGVFGRNPTFNNVDVDGTATLDSIASGTKLEIKGSDNPAAYIEFENTFQNAAIVTQAGLLLGVNSTVGTSYAGVIATENSANSNAVFLDLYANNGSGPFLVARARNNKNFEIVDGDLVVASGHGIDFSATAGTGTSELFDDYEEGTFTPTQGAALTVSGTFSSGGWYTKIGNRVHITGFVAGSTSVSASAGSIFIGGLPFTAAQYAVGSVRPSTFASSYGVATAFNNSNLYSVGTMAAVSNFAFSITYFT